MGSQLQGTLMETSPSIFISGMSQVALMGKQTLSGGPGGGFEVSE